MGRRLDRVRVEKECNGCRMVKALADFHKSERSPDGHHYTCKACSTIRNKARAADPAYREHAKQLYHERYAPKVRARVAANRAANPELHRERQKDWRYRHREKVRLQRERYRRRKGQAPALHCAHVRAFGVWSKAWDAAHREADRRGKKPWLGLSDSESYRMRYRHDEEFRLLERLRRQMRKKMECEPNLPEMVRAALRASGRSNRVEALCGYPIERLRSHLERQFTGAMAWDSFGRHGWHIDHILPKKCFDLTILDGVRAYWALSNLRPLAARENLRKQARVEFLL